jgi:hypothetical protein
LLKTSTIKKSIFFLENKQNSQEQYCQQHWLMCKPALMNMAAIILPLPTCNCEIGVEVYLTNASNNLQRAINYEENF